MPSNGTTYWCSIHEGFSLDTPKYIVAVSHLTEIRIGSKIFISKCYLQYDTHLPHQNALNHIHHMVLYKCLLPEDGSFDKTMESLSEASNNGFRGSPCSELGEIPLLFQFCREDAVVTFPKGEKVS